MNISGEISQICSNDPEYIAAVKAGDKAAIKRIRSKVGKALKQEEVAANPDLKKEESKKRQAYRKKWYAELDPDKKKKLADKHKKYQMTKTAKRREARQAYVDYASKFDYVCCGNCEDCPGYADDECPSNVARLMVETERANWNFRGKIAPPKALKEAYQKGYAEFKRVKREANT